MKTNLNKNLLNLIEREVEKHFLQEGFADWIKKGVSSAVDAWKSIKEKMSVAVGGAKSTLQQKITEAKQAYSTAMQEYNEIKTLEQEAGEKIPNSKLMQMASSLAADGKSVLDEITAEYSQVLATGKNLTSQNVAQEAYINNISSILQETTKKYNSRQTKSKLITEADPFGITGIGLGIIGGLPLLLKGLHKLAAFLKLQKSAVFFQKAYTVAHHFEEKTIDFVIPDKVSYLFYRKKYNTIRGKGQPPPLPFEEYNKSDIKHKVEKQMYVALLTPFLLHGVTAVAHAGISLLGAAEGLATTVKAVEIGKELIGVTKLVKV